VQVLRAMAERATRRGEVEIALLEGLSKYALLRESPSGKRDVSDRPASRCESVGLSPISVHGPPPYARGVSHWKEGQR
jgi:hypothetical protein